MYLFIASVDLTDHTKAELDNVANIFKVPSLCRACMRLSRRAASESPRIWWGLRMLMLTTVSAARFA
jgi:hypothetical protein